MKKDYDFSGWATRNDLLCSDGRIIKRDAFKHSDGLTVPMVWNHAHDDANNIIGHSLLKNKADGVYAYCYLNNTKMGQHVKELVKHGDVSALSICANHLTQKGREVLHGDIKEVSVVVAGANPGAFIDSVMIHGEESDEECIIYTGYDISLEHADKDDTQEKEIAKNNDDTKNNDKETIKDVFNTFSEKQKKVVYYIVEQAIKKEKNKSDNIDEEDDNQEEEAKMKHNAFENDANENNTLLHSDMVDIISDAKRYGSLKESVLAHGITDVDYLFPDAKNYTEAPTWIKRPDAWVSKVMNGVHHTPFSRIKSMHANITEEDARAKGYIKGKLKKEEVFTLLKRTTTPTTIYKKQKLDRDDVVDITDFDVVAWIKTEMRGMLDEEIARQILVGDGRASSSDDKINEQNIRPIWTDDSLYTINKVITLPSTATNSDIAEAFIDATIESREDYRGSGSPSLYAPEDMIIKCLLLKDLNKRRIYNTTNELALGMNVSEIVSVPVMKDLTRIVQSKTRKLLGIIGNLKDYNVGADKGGAVNLFDDFDIDYNAQKYLIETRCSGALVVPYSAIVIELELQSEK